MQNLNNRPRVGLGIIIVNNEGKVLVVKRAGKHAPYYSIPGGHLEAGETFEEGVIREVKEEIDLEIKNPEVIAVTNNLETFHKEGIHSISVVLLAKEFAGVPRIMEPEKFDGWLWADPHDLPMPHFDASQRSIICYLEKIFYKKFE